VVRLANSFLPFPPSLFIVRLLEVSFLHQLLNFVIVEGEMITALIYHPGESDVGYITWYVIFVASSYVGMYAREPALLEARTLF